MPKSIVLTQGQFAIVDDEDFQWLSEWRWFALKSRRQWYAYRHENQEPIYMHRAILDTPLGLVTHHFDGDGLNNQRANLTSCTQEQHQYYHQPDRDARAKRLCNLGISLNFVRVGRDISVQELAILAGVSETTILELERSQYTPQPNTLDRLRKALPGPWQTPANGQLRKVKPRGLGKRTGTTSRYVGVSWSRQYQGWRAEIRVNYKLIYLGLFDSEEEAASVWNAAAVEYRGAKAKQNVIEEEPHDSRV